MKNPVSPPGRAHARALSMLSAGTASADLAVRVVRQTAPPEAKSFVPSLRRAGSRTPSDFHRCQRRRKVHHRWHDGFSHDANVAVRGRRQRDRATSAVGADAATWLGPRDGGRARLFPSLPIRQWFGGAEELLGGIEGELASRFARRTACAAAPRRGRLATPAGSRVLGELFVRGPIDIRRRASSTPKAGGNGCSRGQQPPTDEPRDAHGDQRRRARGLRLAWFCKERCGPSQAPDSVSVGN